MDIHKTAMINYNFANLKNQLELNKDKVILFGAGDIGELYRCPFSANAHNLRAIPEDKSDVVDHCDEKISIISLKEKIKDIAYNKDFLTACLYCNGRDYNVAEIKSAEQTRKPLQYERI